MSWFLMEDVQNSIESHVMHASMIGSFKEALDKFMD